MEIKKVPHYQRIARQLKSAIEHGELAPGSRLPASRVYAQELGVSRATVENAWGELVAQGWLELGPDIVVVTRGATGSEAWTRRGHASAPSRLVEVVDTVGAGDTFQAALLTWLAEHDALAPGQAASLDLTQVQAMLQFGARAASITCSRRGADLPRREELG